MEGLIQKLPRTWISRTTNTSETLPGDGVATFLVDSALPRKGVMRPLFRTKFLWTKTWSSLPAGGGCSKKKSPRKHPTVDGSGLLFNPNPSGHQQHKVT